MTHRWWWALLLVVPAGLGVAVLASAELRGLLRQYLPTTVFIQLAALRHGIAVNHDVRIPVGDGVSLAASVYLPRGEAGPIPTVLIRTPYGRRTHGAAFHSALEFAQRGYAAIVQDLRGTGDSGGELLPWQYAASDGVATLDWITAQNWSNGKVGTFGCSALGETQLVLAARNHPAHAAMIPIGAGGAVGSAAGRYGYFGVFEGGVLQLASAVGWFLESGAKRPGTPPARPHDRMELLQQLPVAGLVERVRPGPSGFDDFVRAVPGDPRWTEWGYLSDEDVSRVPALVINTWGDQTVGETLALAEKWRRTGIVQRVVIGSGNHCEHDSGPTVEHRFGALTVGGTAWPWWDWYLAWFDHWLKGEPAAVPLHHNYHFYVVGADRWMSSDSWPPAETVTQRWYLGSLRGANGRKGDGWLTLQKRRGRVADQFRYDPMDPVPSRGGPICCTGNRHELAGPADQADVEARSDVLVYTSEPLAEDLLIAGPLRLHLALSADVSDTDVVARLVHVWPDGRATSIQEGALRLRYRDGFDRPSFMQPGMTYHVAVGMRDIAYRLPRGHRMRLHVTGSSFPRLERNLNTGAANNALETQYRVAMTELHYDDPRESYLEMFVWRAGKHLEDGQ